MGGWYLVNRTNKHPSPINRSRRRRTTYQQDDKARHDDEEDELRASLTLARLTRLAGTVEVEVGLAQGTQRAHVREGAPKDRDRENVGGR